MPAASKSSDYYSILQIPRSAETADIRKSYRKLALKWHPDKNINNKELAEKRFKKISEAYEVLSDPKKKEIYDKYGKEGLEGRTSGRGMPDSYGMGNFGGFPFHFRDPEDVFREFFGNSDPFQGFNFGFGGGFGSPFFSQSPFENNFVQMRNHTPMQSMFLIDNFGVGSHSAFNSTTFSSGGHGGRGNFRSTSTTTKVINGKKIVTKKIIDNGQETVTVTENDVVVSKTLNGQPLSLGQ